jgi:hypothetical protein
MSQSEVSLDISSVDSSSNGSEDEDLTLEKEWQEGLDQLQQIVSIVLLPYVGKYFGRKWSYWRECLRSLPHIAFRILTSAPCSV